MRTQNKNNEMEAVMNKPTSKRRSVPLTEKEVVRFNKYVASFNTIIECAESIGIHRNVLDRIILTHSGSPESIEKIRSVLTQDNKAA